ncbi:glycosyltransferase family 2 protein [Marinicaulis aureus]|uniref:Glycosyltransferase family 2 protein n=1 Tax=Hyphococcus aureus TaxID=2666033 RepID=A0ABW1KTZ3_9PROT
MALEQGEGWTVVIPYYNERSFLAATIASLREQTVRPLRLVLVDNASTDGSVQVARAALAEVDGVDVTFLHEATPGQAAALERGIANASTRFTAICDADTIYPPDYLARAQTRFDAEGAHIAAVLATALYNRPDSADSRLRRLKMRIAPQLLRRQCHAGGYAHTFRTDALKRAGGYSRKIWPHLRKDHELIHRVWKQGRVIHDPSLWCLASDRRSAALQKRWTLFERLLYHATPFQLKDWYFYRFLGPRMAARAHDELKLRERPWENEGEKMSHRMNATR